jgi:hypothetical protein
VARAPRAALSAGGRIRAGVAMSEPTPTSPIQFAVGRPRDPHPPEHLELTLTSLTAAEALIDQLQIASRKLMLGQPKAITIIQGRLVPHANR